MVTERGTLSRGAATDQQTWAEPTAPGGRRLPSAPRERKPALAALAVLLVALGAVAAGLLVINAGHRVAAVEIVQQVGQGQQIPASAAHPPDVVPLPELPTDPPVVAVPVDVPLPVVAPTPVEPEDVPVELADVPSDGEW